MKTLSVSQFKATMARRLREVQSGERIVLTNHKRPVAVVGPVSGDDPVQRPPLHAFHLPPVAAVPSFRGPVSDLLAEERGES